VRARNRDADLAENSFGQSVFFQTFPSDAVVFRSIQTAARSATREKPGLPARLPKRGEDDVRVVRIEYDFNAAGVFVFAQDFRPVFAAVSRAKNSALLIWTERMPKRRDQNNVCVSRIDNQRANLATVF